MSFEIVTDSCCNLSEDMIEDFGIHILPMTFMVDGKQYQSYLKGKRTDLKQFYAMMHAGKVITTSLPNMVNAEALFTSILDAGNDLLYIGFSSGLSSTFETVNAILERLRTQYPERVIYSVDTLAASCGEGLLIYHAIKKARAGASIDEIYMWLEENKLHIAHWFTVEDLMFLFRGGRVSRTAAWAGTVLNIKPVLHVDDEGHLIPLEKVRGRKKSINAIIRHFSQTCYRPFEDQEIFIGHADCPEDAEYLKNELQRIYGVKTIFTNWLDPVIGAHSGPGTLAVFYLGSER